jgi:hypothetical protein
MATAIARARARARIREPHTLFRALSKNMLSNHTITSHQPPATSRPLPVTSHQHQPCLPGLSLHPCSLSPQTLARRPRSLFAASMSDGCNSRPALAGGDPVDWFLSRQPPEPINLRPCTEEAVWYACRENGEKGVGRWTWDVVVVVDVGCATG